MPENRNDAGGTKRGGPGQGTDPGANRPTDEKVTRRVGDQGQQRGDQDHGTQAGNKQEGNKGKGNGGGGGGSQKINAPQQGKSQNGAGQGG